MTAPTPATAAERARAAIAKAISPQRWANLNAGEESSVLAEAERLLATALRAAEAGAFEKAAQWADTQATNANGLRPSEWTECAKFIAAQIRALTSSPATASPPIKYSDLGIDLNNPNPDGSDYHLMNAIDEAAASPSTKRFSEKEIHEIVNRRYGRIHDKPCADPNMLTCAMWECQVADYCRKAPSPGRADPPREGTTK